MLRCPTSRICILARLVCAGDTKVTVTLADELMQRLSHRLTRVDPSSTHSLLFLCPLSSLPGPTVIASLVRPLLAALRAIQVISCRAVPQCLEVTRPYLTARA